MKSTLILGLALVATLSVVSSVSAQTFDSSLDGAQVDPPVATSGRGSANLDLDSEGMLSFEMVYSGLIYQETETHIHGPTPEGANAEVKITLPYGPSKSGLVGPLTPQEQADLNAGLWYINVHTLGHPGGEIRGYIRKITVTTQPASWGLLKGEFRPPRQ